MCWDEETEGVVKVLHEKRAQLNMRYEVSVKSFFDVLEFVGKVWFVEFGDADSSFVCHFFKIEVVEILFEFSFAQRLLLVDGDLIGKFPFEIFKAPIEYYLVVFLSAL